MAAETPLPMRRPLVALATAFAAGLLLADRAGLPPWPGLAAALPLVALASALALRGRGGPLRFLAWTAAALSLGAARGTPPEVAPGEPAAEAEVLLGIARTGFTRTPDGLRLLVEAEAVRSLEGETRPWSGGVSLTLRPGPEGLGSCPRVLPGDRLRALVRLQRLRGARNFGLPDPLLAQQRRGLSWLGRLHGCQDLSLELAAPVWSPRRAAEQARAAVTALLEERAAPREAREVLIALTTGDAGGVPDAVRQAYARSGLAHLLAVSGLHVGCVALGLYLLLRFLLLRLPRLPLRCDVRRLAAGLCLPAVGFYVLLTGAQAPVVRAGVMVATFLLAEILRRRADALQSLAAAGLVILGLWPQALFSASFQLSFAAALGLILAAPPLCARLGAPWSPAPEGRLARVRARIVQSLVVSLVAGLCTAPLVAHHFGQVSWMGLAANLVGVPLTTWLIVPLGLLAALVLPLWEAAAGWLADAGLGLCQALNGLAEALAAVPGAGLEVQPPGWAAVALLFLLLGSLVWLRRHRAARALACGAAVGLVLLGAWSLIAPRLGGDLELVALDVGQGDALLVRLPAGEALLVDGGRGPDAAGGAYDASARVLLPALRALGVRRLHAAVATHLHPDHAGGLVRAIRELRPRELWLPSGEDWRADEETRVTRQALLAAASEVGARVRELGAGARPLAPGGEVTIEVLWPPRQGAEGLEVNERSLVLRVALGERRALLTGDLEADGERALVTGGGDLGAEVLKVGHHGSLNASSSSFLAAVAPRLALVSVGAGNPYGLPHPSAMERLRGAGARILRTDSVGAVRLQTDGGPWRVECYAACGPEPVGGD